MIENSKIPVFVVVDSDDNQTFIRTALDQITGLYLIVGFNNGPEFIDYLNEELKQQSADDIHWFVILNVDLPVQSGIEVMNIMRQHSLWKRIPVILVTHQDESYPESRPQAPGKTDYLPKPSSFAELGQHIKTRVVPWLENLV